ncbi:hypothetical protein AAEX28_06540 [Lentisphaerota bacterium WC36G]|nr:hypothetical protein LJT99_09405 [Lentisphaerae bacterium WC36]
MRKSMLYKFFRIGKIPLKIRKTFNENKIKFKEEGIKTSVIFTKFMSKNHTTLYRKMIGSSAIL